MLSLDEALQRYAQRLTPLPTDSAPLSRAHGLVLAEDVTALLPLPPMTQSAMDGYALRSTDVAAATDARPVALPISGESAAGSQPCPLPPGRCMRIFTGAPLPAGADAVQIQENVSREDEAVVFAAPLKAGANVRQAGEEVHQGQVLLPAGTRLDARSLSIAASVGHAELRVHRRLRAAVIVTGDELVAPGSPRAGGQIFESNGTYLQHFLAELGADCASVNHCPDQPGPLRDAITQALSQADLLLLSGGASVGDRDFSRAAVTECGVVEDFWKVAQKPGKPLSFGLGPQGQCVFVLPGNPASVHACAQVHVRSAICRMQGAGPPPVVTARITHAQRGDGRREWLLRADYQLDADGLHVEVLPRQASHMLSNLSRARALLRIPAGAALAPGDPVQAWLLS